MRGRPDPRGRQARAVLRVGEPRRRGVRRPVRVPDRPRPEPAPRVRHRHALLHGRAPRPARDGDGVPPPARAARVVRGDRPGGATELGGQRRDQAPPGPLPPRPDRAGGDAMELPTLRRAPACRSRPSASAARRSVAATATSRSASSPAPSAARSTSASTCSTPPRPTASARRRRRSAARCGGRRDEAIVVDQVRHRVPGPPNFRDGSAERVPRVDRREPAAPRHRPRRRLHRALARPRDAVRGDAGCARRARARRARCASSASRTSPPTSSTACMQMRRVDVVQYVHSLFDRRMEREILPYCAEHGIGVRRPTARSPTGC